MLQRANHWIQSSSGTGYITSSYSSNGGETIDLYVYTDGWTCGGRLK
ncbi:MAG: hypothetical protein Q4D38_03290 [Planctomycetia bacterium]|nr:hypothetical protein [Planctomycetia bacterium]